MPAIPIAESSAPIVVGISATSSAISVVTDELGAGEQAERPQRDDDDHEDQRQRGQQDAERDLVRGLAPLGALDEGDHPVEEGLARLLGDLDDDPVREHLGAAGDGAAVAAGLADHGRRLAGDRRLVDRGDALDHGAVARDRLAGLDDHDVAPDAARRRASRRRRAAAPCLGPHRAQAGGLRVAAALGERLGEVGEHDGEPQPDGDGEGEPGGLVAAAERGAAEDLDQPRHRGDQGADLDHEHHRVAHLDARVELAQRLEQRRAHDLGVEQRAGLSLGHLIGASSSSARLS